MGSTTGSRLGDTRLNCPLHTWDGLLYLRGKHRSSGYQKWLQRGRGGQWQEHPRPLVIVLESFIYNKNDVQERLSVSITQGLKFSSSVLDISDQDIVFVEVLEVSACPRLFRKASFMTFYRTQRGLHNFPLNNSAERKETLLFELWNIFLS